MSFIYGDMQNQLVATLNKNTGAYIRLFKFIGNAICFRSFGKEILRWNISNEISLGNLDVDNFGSINGNHRCHAIF